jgi:glycosyltransferase involved in cell wall biosynthesis
VNILCANKFFHLNGGSERVFFQERSFLLERGHKVIDFSMEDQRNFPSPFAEFFVPNVDYRDSSGLRSKVRQSVSFIHSTIAMKNLEKLIRWVKPEIAHLHNIYHQLTPSIIPLLKKHGVKVVLTLHDCKLVCPSYLSLKNGIICEECRGEYFWKPLTTNCQNSRSKGLLLSAEAIWHKRKRSYEHVDLFISPSRFVAELTACRVPSAKIRVLHNGIDVGVYQPNYEDKSYGLYLGRLSREKGIETLLNACTAGRTVLPLKVVGTGPLENKLRVAYPGIQFLSYKTGQELNNLISNAAYVVVPSECYENCSMVVLEAMALGKPVIGSRIGGIPEQIKDGKTGFLFEMGNTDELAAKMEMLSTNKELRLRMGKAARRKLEQEYSLQAHCEGLLDIYSELLGRDVWKDEVDK